MLSPFLFITLSCDVMSVKHYTPGRPNGIQQSHQPYRHCVSQRGIGLSPLTTRGKSGTLVI